MTDKKEIIDSGKDVELDGVTVLNGISLAEKKEIIPEKVEEPKVEEPITKTVTNEEEQKQDNVVNNEVNETVIPSGTAEVDFSAGIPLPVNPVIAPNEAITPDVPITPNISIEVPTSSTFDTQNNVSSIPTYDAMPNNEISGYNENAVNFNSNYNNFNNSNFNNTNFSNSNVSDYTSDFVFKSPEDVDLAMEKIIEDIRRSYEENLSGPVKVLAEFVSEFMSWGDKVTSNGLNRDLFEQYDRLVEKVKNCSSAVNNTKSFNNSSYNDYVNYNDDNNYGGITKF